MTSEDLDRLDELSLEEIADKIESMEIRGAALIGRAAAVALKNHLEVVEVDDLDAFREEIEKARNRLLSTRPTAVSLYNAVESILPSEIESIGSAREYVRERSDRFVQRSIQARKKIAEYGGKRIKDGDTVLTHCNSSLALGAIKYAWDMGKDIDVVSTESRPKKQGLITIKELSEYDIPVSLIVDSAVRYFMSKVDKVYIGADAIASNGAVINKIGTSQVALCADESRVPVTVCAETYKFARETAFGDLIDIEERDPSEIVEPSEFPDVKIRNPVFDATPPEFVDAIITEEGIISPSEAYSIIKEMEG